MVNKPEYILNIWPRARISDHLAVLLDSFGNDSRILYGTLGEIYNWSVIPALGL